jgi:hypothetical protein
VSARVFLAAAIVASAQLFSPAAGAYCRSSVCDDGVQGTVCVPAGPFDCGTPLVWKQPCVGFAVHEEASQQVSYESTEALLQRAADTWTSVSCPGGPPSIRMTDLGSVQCGAVEYNQKGGNANLVAYRDDEWPYGDSFDRRSSDTIALTTVTYDVNTGEIFDADIEINAANFQFRTELPEVEGNPDLLAVLTHEMGHFLGLAHSLANDATMYATYRGAEESSLRADDIAAVCAAYPIDRETTGECDSIPRHGFSPACFTEQTEGNCALAPGAPPAAPGAALGLGALAAIAGVSARLVRARSARRLRGESPTARGPRRRRT